MMFSYALTFSDALALSAWAWLGMIAVMTVLWLVQRRTGDAGVVDVGWAAGLGAVAVFYAAGAEGDPFRRVLLGAIAGAWSVRLASHLLFDRILRGAVDGVDGVDAEDGRYATLREEWGAGAQTRFFWFFQAQALLVVVLAVPFLVVAGNPSAAPSAFDLAAVLLFVISVGGEWLADRQLARFRRDSANRGRTCREGLWRYSRHPNYFFEWLHWLTYPLLAAGSGWVWITFLSAAVILFFVTRVTGIPPTEEQALRSRGDDYRRYQQTTSAFFPWFPHAVPGGDTGARPAEDSR